MSSIAATKYLERPVQTKIAIAHRSLSPAVSLASSTFHHIIVSSSARAVPDPCRIVRRDVKVLSLKTIERASFCYSLARLHVRCA